MSRTDADLPSGAPPIGSIPIVAQTFKASDLPPARQVVAMRIEAFGVGGVHLGDFLLVLTELVANAISHGGGGGHLQVWVCDGHLHCAVVDAGPGLPPDYVIARDPPPPTQTSGRGLWLARTLSTTLAITSGATGTTVHAAVAISS
jgi:anti-sigma regulatory factor (Ser/Thr protein kinase)